MNIRKEYIYPQERGIIGLDSSFVSELVKYFKQMAKGKKIKRELKEIFAKNPRGNELIEAFKKYQDVEPFRSMIIWLNLFPVDFAEVPQLLKQSNISLNQIINNWLSYLYDASYRKFFADRYKKIDVTVRGQEIIIKNSVLATISNYPKKRNGLEYTGLLIGNRNNELLVEEITDFILIKSGRKSMVPTSFTKFMLSFFKRKGEN